MTEEDQRLAILCAIGALAEDLTGKPLVVDVPAKDGVHTMIIGRQRVVAAEVPISDLATGLPSHPGRRFEPDATAQAAP